MPVRMLVLIGVICSLVTQSYGDICDFSMANVTCYTDNNLVIRFEVLSERQPNPNSTNDGYYQTLKRVKTYKCYNPFGTTKVELCTTADDVIFNTYPHSATMNIVLEVGVEYLISASSLYAGGNRITYYNCSYVEKWEDVKAEEDQLSNEEGTLDCQTCYLY